MILMELYNSLSVTPTVTLTSTAAIWVRNCIIGYYLADEIQYLTIYRRAVNACAIKVAYEFLLLETPPLELITNNGLTNLSGSYYSIVKAFDSLPDFFPINGTSIIRVGINYIISSRESDFMITLSEKLLKTWLNYHVYGEVMPYSIREYQFPIVFDNSIVAPLSQVTYSNYFTQRAYFRGPLINVESNPDTLADIIMSFRHSIELGVTKVFTAGYLTTEEI